MADKAVLGMTDVELIDQFNSLVDEVNDNTPTDYYWANVKVSASSSTTTNPRFQSMRARNAVYGLARGQTTGTPTATILHTGIKWTSGSYMPVLHFTGYAYGLQSPVEFKVGFYIYSDRIGYCGATNMGAWKPEIRLFRETRDSVDYVAVALIGSCYYLGLSVGIQEEKGSIPSTIDLTPSKWSFEFLTSYTTDDIPDGNTPPHATCCTVPYKQILNSLGKINFKLAGTTQETYTGAETSIDFNVPNATTSASGLMTAAMVTKLNGITANADNVSFTRTLTSGTEIGSISINGTATKLYAPTPEEGGLNRQEVVDIVDTALEQYVHTQSLEDGRYDLSAYLNNYALASTVSSLSNRVDVIIMDTIQDLENGRFDLSAYEFASLQSVSTLSSTVGNNSTKWQHLEDGDFDFSAYGFATESYVSTAISNLVDSSPDALNTLNELAAALGDDPNFATTVATEIGKKQATITGGATTITSANLTASRALISNANGKVAVSAVTSTELGYLDGVTSAIQTQLNNRVTLSTSQTITGDKVTTGLFKIQNGSAAGAFVLGADVNAKTLTVNQRKLGRMGVPSYDSTTKTMAGISFDSQANVNYADFGGHPSNTSSIAPDVIRFVVANSHTNAVNVPRTLALQISKQAGLVDAAGGWTSVLGAKFFVPVIVDGNLSATSITENGTALSSKYQAKGSYLTSVPTASSSAIGGIKLGYSATGKNYAVQLDSNGKAYVNVPWSAGETADLSNYSTLANTIKSLSISGTTITYTKGDNTTGMLTTQDTKVTQTKTTSSSSMPLLLAPAGQTATTTTTTNFTNNIYAVPSSGRLYVTGSSNPLFGIQASGGTQFFLQALTDTLYLGPTSSKALAFTGSTGAISMPNNLTVAGTISEGGTSLSSKYLGISAQASSAAKVANSVTYQIINTTSGTLSQLSYDGSSVVTVGAQTSPIAYAGYALIASTANSVAWSNVTDKPSSYYTLPVSTSSARGGIKIGYSATGANIPVQLSSEKAYVALTKTAVTSALGYTPPNVDLSGYTQNTNNPNLSYFATDNGTTTAGTWIASCSNVTELFDGLSVKYEITKAGASTTTFNLNGLGAKTVYLRGTTKLTTHYAVNTMIHLIYNASTGAWYVADYDTTSGQFRHYYTLTTANNEYPIVYSYTTATGTSSYKTTYGAVKGGFTFNPSTDTLSVGNIDTTSVTENGTALSEKYAPMSHTHDGSDITSGTVAAARLPYAVKSTSSSTTSGTKGAVRIRVYGGNLYIYTS